MTSLSSFSKNLDNFLDEAESLLKSGQDDNEVSMDDEGVDLADLLQIGDGDLIPMKDIPMVMMGMTSALQVKKEYLVEKESKQLKNKENVQLKREAKTEPVLQNVVPRMSMRKRNRSVKQETKPIENLFEHQEIVQSKAKKTEADWFNKFGIRIPGSAASP